MGDFSAGEMRRFGCVLLWDDLLGRPMGHDVSNMRGFDSYRLLTLSLAALMTRISSAMIEVPILAQELPHSPGPSPSGSGSAARESR